MYEKVVKMLVENGETETHEERQQAFLDLMLVDSFEHFQPEHLLTLARNAELLVYLTKVTAGFHDIKFNADTKNFDFSYYVCSEIHESKGEHGQVLRCYLLDPLRKHNVFGYLERSQHKVELKPHVMENLDVIVDNLLMKKIR